jgi:hypothetical protein
MCRHMCRYIDETIVYALLRLESAYKSICLHTTFHSDWTDAVDSLHKTIKPNPH